MWKRKMARVSQLPLRLLPRARNLLFRLSPSELLTTKQKNDSSEPCGFRPLTEDEKKEFEKSLNEDGKRMLREISGKLLTDVEIKQKRKKTIRPVSDADPHY